ncbi:c-type cytochrome [Celeribacter indicus]|uniref:Cytochrome c family protein n=1 Tax=Celeribacter indicus TaxID=1208324 RepID=A0A0B5DY06_9RHOB|nr:cytochrome c550 [Celeribacter indicus]AJE47879.1 cytochrome c family protein [Celeribacter indicus]SDW25846.1 cytochrome c [Celeribacter indicus]
MTKLFAFTAAALLASTAATFAQGDAANGEKEFRKCKSCHMIASEEETFVKGGKTGPNLHGVVGRPVASVEGFNYGDGILAVGATGAVWDEASLAEYVADPTEYIDTHGGSGRSKMTFKLPKGGEDVAAYLATFSEDAPAADEAPAEDAPAEDAPATE